MIVGHKALRLSPRIKVGEPVEPFRDLHIRFVILEG